MSIRDFKAALSSPKFAGFLESMSISTEAGGQPRISGQSACLAAVRLSDMRRSYADSKAVRKGFFAGCWRPVHFHGHRQAIDLPLCLVVPCCERLAAQEKLFEKDVLNQSAGGRQVCKCYIELLWQAEAEAFARACLGLCPQREEWLGRPGRVCERMPQLARTGQEPPAVASKCLENICRFLGSSPGHTSPEPTH